MIETLKMDALLVAFGFTFYFSPYFNVLLQLENGSNYACVVLCWPKVPQKVKDYTDTN